MIKKENLISPALVVFGNTAVPGSILRWLKGILFLFSFIPHVICAERWGRRFLSPA